MNAKRTSTEGRPLRPMLVASEVAEILSMSTHRIYELTRRGILPHTRIGRQIRYDPMRLREWIDAGGTDGRDET